MAPTRPATAPAARAPRATTRWREEALARLHALLLRAARFEVARRRVMLTYLRGDELDDIALTGFGRALVARHR